MEKAIENLNTAKLILCNQQMLTHEMCIRIGQAITSAIALLKEQEPVEPTFRQGEDGVFVWACGSCGAYMYHIYDGIDKAKEYAKYCRQCGKKVKWE